MLSLDSAMYRSPVRVKDGEESKWRVEHVDGHEARIASELFYTLLPQQARELGFMQVEQKLTFHYDQYGNVSAAPRTMRINGNNLLRPIISFLMNQSRKANSGLEKDLKKVDPATDLAPTNGEGASAKAGSSKIRSLDENIGCTYMRHPK